MAFRLYGSAVMLLSIAALGIPPLHAQADSQQWTIKIDMHEAAMRVLVTDAKHQPITDIKAADFSLTQDGKPLVITSVHLEDTPACIGLLLDKSGSMRSKNPTATSSVMGFVTASNPADKFFVVNFKDYSYLDQDYTSDSGKIQEAIGWREAHGGTALYDAVIASGDHLIKNKDCERRILIVLTDGADNESRKPLPLTIDYLKKMKGLSMRLVMITDSEPNVHASHRALEELVAPVKGEALFVSLNKLEKTFEQMAVELRKQYVITYKLESPSNSGLSNITVSARAEGHKDLRVRIEPAEISGGIAAGK
ncbi:MAG TPA: VWA domain-containing protein [Candidatus Angelobacter sp.]|jgi:VWFA-related protein